jgi:hypothetical protein
MEVRTADTQDLVANASQGMTLRDYFAGKALTGIFAANANGATYEHICEAAYKTADAMLVELNKPAVSSVAQNKIDQLRKQGFKDYPIPVAATLQNGMHVCTVDHFGQVRWFSKDGASYGI